jgi:hypothetical protein
MAKIALGCEGVCHHRPFTAEPERVDKRVEVFIDSVTDAGSIPAGFTNLLWMLKHGTFH